MSTPHIQKLLQEGIAAAKAAQDRGAEPDRSPIQRLPSTKQKQRARARELLLQVVELDETIVPAWLWLSAVMDEVADKRTCLTNVLALEPTNKAAQAGLARLPAPAPEADPAPPEPASQPTLAKTTGQAGCPFCQQPITPMDTTCPHCQLPLVMTCPACNTLMDVEWSTCSQCGYPMGDYKLGSVYFTQLATAYEQHKRPQQAIEALRLAEQMEPDQPDLYRHIGEVQASLGHIQAAVETLQRAIDQEPEQVGPYLSLGHVYQQEGHWRQAAKVYRQAMETAPDSAAPYFALGDLFLIRNQFNKASKLLQKATRLDPGYGEAWARLGQIYERTGKQAAARRAYHQAAGLLPADSFEGQQVRARIEILEPRLPARHARSWLEFIRESSGPILICLLAVLLDSGLRPWWNPWTGWLALLLAIMGAWLWVSGSSLPKNPLIRLVTGGGGLQHFELQQGVAVLGALLWLLGLALILLPIGQSPPEWSP